MNFRKKLCHLCKNLKNFFLLIHFLFIVICNSENGYNLNAISKTDASNVSSNGELQHRERRSVRRGENNYFQKSYEMNRLRHDFESRLRAPRHKPFFHTVNEVYSYYLPPKFTKINANVENFSDKLLDNHSYGTKTRSMTRARGEERFTLTRRILPPADYQTISGPPSLADRVGSPLSSSQYQSDQQKYRTQYQRYSPRLERPETRPDRYSPRIGRAQPFESSDDGINYSRNSSSSLLRQSDSSGLISEPQNLIRNSTFPGIPGYQRVDFPGYAKVPYTGFRCASQSYYGYYADVTAGCQVFHVCQPDGREYSFLCPNSTLFHQKVQTCDWWWHVDCPSSPRYYYLNARIGVLPPVDATLYRFPKA